MPLSACINQTAVMLEEIRGCEASTGWVWDFLVDTGVSRLKGKCDDNKEVHFVDTISKSAVHK